MSAIDSPPVLRPTLVDILFTIFLRLVALSCFAYGLYYWAMIVGLSNGGQMRFDLLSSPWRAAAASLAVLMPVAALGLWLTVSWGPVIWVLAAGAEIIMYDVRSDVFGEAPMVLVMHSAVAVTYILFRVILWRERRLKQLQVRTDLP